MEGRGDAETRRSADGAMERPGIIPASARLPVPASARLPVPASARLPVPASAHLPSPVPLNLNPFKNLLDTPPGRA